MSKLFVFRGIDSYRKVLTGLMLSKTGRVMRDLRLWFGLIVTVLVLLHILINDGEKWWGIKDDTFNLIDFLLCNSGRYIKTRPNN